MNIGFAVPSGAEAAVHAARAFSEKAGDEDVLLKINFADAFNTVRRNEAANWIAEVCPDVFPLFSLSYEEGAYLFFGKELLYSSEDYQQSDPLAVFYFCLCFRFKLEILNSRFNEGYLDDVSVGDNWQTVMKDLVDL